MKLHANARLSPKGRLVMCRRVVEVEWSLGEAAEAAGVSERTCCRWVERYRAEGEAGLSDRSSAPERQPNRTPKGRLEAIACLRRLRFSGQEIALTLGMALSTVSGILTRIGLGRLSRLGPPEPPNRYEKSRPGELLHIDVKKLGRIGTGAGHRATGKRGEGQRSRGVGWEFVHICVDDATRLAYAEVLDDERATTCIAFLMRCLRFYRRHGITVERLMTATARPTARPCTRSPAARSRSSTPAPSPTGTGRTARRSASSARCSPAGPTARSTATRPSGPTPCPAGSTSTTTDDHTAPSATSPRQPASAS
jgi:hypothetical protein